MVHLRSYNEKLSRKGLLERGLKTGKLIGDFKAIENGLMKSLARHEDDNDYLMRNSIAAKTEAVNNELNVLKNALKNLDTTIGILRIEVKSIVDRSTYEKWTKHVNEQSTKFNKMFSKSNEFYYKIAEETNNEMTNVYYNINYFANKSLIPYEENIKKKKEIEKETEEIRMIFAKDTDGMTLDSEPPTEKRKCEKAVYKNRPPLAEVQENSIHLVKKTRWN